MSRFIAKRREIWRRYLLDRADRAERKARQLRERADRLRPAVRYILHGPLQHAEHCSRTFMPQYVDGVASCQECGAEVAAHVELGDRLTTQRSR